ncbi:LicD family protein [Ruminococcus flavefaciens]|uniref:LicD family protein n=1 Tax=Ruminococcus flavefaciens TaxID=1265 RepID=UPI00048C1A37|nr:LicD family protein [Ruminococcus flavefaciens]
MNEVQKLQLDLLIKLDEVCRRHNLNYYLAYGSCIGAMRHKGFIPWDHDVDVLMPIEDAIKLTKYQDEFGKDYFVSSWRTDPEYKCTNMRLVDKRNRCIVRKNGKIIENDHLCMDIYPFYNCPPTKIGLLLNILRSHLYKMLVGGGPKNHGKLAAVLSGVILFLFSEKNRERDIRRVEKKLRYKGKSFEIADYYGLDIKLFSAITYKKEWFAKPKELTFEGHSFYGPTNPHAYLTKRYGDYMKPPSKSAIKEEAVVELIKE